MRCPGWSRSSVDRSKEGRRWRTGSSWRRRTPNPPGDARPRPWAAPWGWEGRQGGRARGDVHGPKNGDRTHGGSLWLKVETRSQCRSSRDIKRMCRRSWPSRMTCGTGLEGRPRRYNRRVRPIRILMVAGFLVWALCGIDVLGSLASSPWPGPSRRLRPGFSSWPRFFAKAFARDESTSPGPGRAVGLRPHPHLVVGRRRYCRSASGNDRGPAARGFPMRASLVWLMVQTFLAFLPRMEAGRPLLAGVGALAYLAFELFAVGAAGLAESERIGPGGAGRGQGAARSVAGASCRDLAGGGTAEDCPGPA